MRKRGGMWFAERAICVASLVVASHAGAVRQGPLGATSTGSIGITVSLAACARTSAPDVIHFGGPAGTASKTSQHLCLSSDSRARAFSFSVTGNDKAGALMLSDGYRSVAYDVKSAPQEDAALGDDGSTREGSSGGCDHSQRAIAFVVALDPQHLDQIDTGAALTGILTLIVAPS